MSNHYDPTADSMMRMPSPDAPNSGWVDRNPGYAAGSAAGPAPEGKVFVPGVNTYVDVDIAEQLGLTGPSGTPAVSDGPVPTGTSTFNNAAALNPEAIPSGADPLEDVNIEEMTDRELEALQEQLEIKDDGTTTSLSETLDEIADCFTPTEVTDSIDTMVATGDLSDIVETMQDALGFDAQTTSTLIETTVMEASPIASEYIGGDRWSSLVYAASRTDDPFARRVVADVVSGKLNPSKLGGAYDLWYQSLPDADD